jgi:cyclophilin family peptidyl-prolyl cis-trans isomerase
MTHLPPLARTPRTPLAAALAAACLLAACGGGGGGGGAAPTNPTISNGTVALEGTTNVQPQYSRRVVLTLTGTELGAANLTVTNPACSGLQRGAAAPYASSETTAYYLCTVNTVGTGRFEVRRSADGQLLRAAEYPVPDPQVRMVFNNDPTFFLVLTLDTRAPVTVRNFLDYVNAGFYDGTVIHRLVPGFVVQGGGFAAPVGTALPTPKPTQPAIPLEIVPDLLNLKGTIAMARTAAPNSATSQFFLNLADNPSLDKAPLNDGYAVFGRVTTGAALLDSGGAIAAAPCTLVPWLPADGSCLPNPNLVVTSATQSR